VDARSGGLSTNGRDVPPSGLKPNSQDLYGRSTTNSQDLYGRSPIEQPGSLREIHYEQPGSLREILKTKKACGFDTAGLWKFSDGLWKD
jgi:hypothetical protein